MYPSLNMLSIVSPSPSCVTYSAWKPFAPQPDSNQAPSSFNPALITPHALKIVVPREMMAFLCSTDVTHLKSREVQIPHYHIKSALVALSAGKENFQEFWLLLEHRNATNCSETITCAALVDVQGQNPKRLCQTGRAKSIRLDWQMDSAGDLQTTGKTSTVNILPLGCNSVGQPPLRVTNWTRQSS